MAVYSATPAWVVSAATTARCSALAASASRTACKRAALAPAAARRLRSSVTAVATGAGSVSAASQRS